MKNLKAYILDLGYAQGDSNWFEAHSTVGTIFDEHPPRKWINLPFYAILIDHPAAGWILFDTGAVAAEDWPKNLAAVIKVFNGGEHTITEQLKKVGVKPKDIKHVIISHMHIDHIGGMKLFKDATFYVQRRDAETAYTTVMGSPDITTYGFYYKPAVLTETKKTVYIDEDEEIFEGVHLINVGGHTAGVLGLLLELESGNVLVTSDATYTMASYMGHPSGLNYDSVEAAKSVRKLHKIEKQFKCKQVWFGHDAEQFAKMKKAPESYA